MANLTEEIRNLMPGRARANWSLTESGPDWKSAAKKLLSKRTGKSQHDLHYRAYLRAIVSGDTAQATHMVQNFPAAKKAQADLIDLAGMGESVEEAKANWSLDEARLAEGSRPLPSPKLIKDMRYRISLFPEAKLKTLRKHLSTYILHIDNISSAEADVLGRWMDKHGLTFPYHTSEEMQNLHKTRMFQSGRKVIDGTFGVRIPDDDEEDDDDLDEALAEAKAAPMPPTMLKKLKALSPEALRLLNTLKDNPKYRGQAASDAAKNALDKSGLTSTIHALEDPAKDVVRLTKMGKKVVAALKKRGLSAVQVVKESVAGAPGAFAVSDAEPASLEAMKADLLDRVRNPRWEYPSWALPKVKLDEERQIPLNPSKKWALWLHKGKFGLTFQKTPAGIRVLGTKAQWSKAADAIEADGAQLKGRARAGHSRMVKMLRDL